MFTIFFELIVKGFFSAPYVLSDGVCQEHFKIHFEKFGFNSVQLIIIESTGNQLELEDEKSSESDSVEVTIIYSAKVNSAIVLLLSYRHESRERFRSHLKSLDDIEY